MILRAYMYGNPEDFLDRKRAEEKKHKEFLGRERKRKAKRITAMVINKMKGIA